MATEIITSFQQITDSSGDPLSGAKIYVYNVGTTTLRSIYSEITLTTAAANPIICDSEGRHDMRYTAVGSYKIVVKTSADVTSYTRDNIDGRIPVGTNGILAIANGGTGANVAATALSNLGGVTAAEFADLSADVAALVGASASTEKTHIATGTTAQRPAAPAEGDVRRNTTLSTYEGYNGSAWVNFVVQPTAITDPSATDTQEGLIELAVQSEMETGTDVVRAVTPGRVQYHPGVAKAWGKFAGASGTIATSHNVTSVVRADAGDYTVTIATDFSSADYAILLTTFASSGIPTTYVLSQAAGVFTIKCVNAAGTDLDPDAIYFACFGDQA